MLAHTIAQMNLQVGLPDMHLIRSTSTDNTSWRHSILLNCSLFKMHATYAGCNGFFQCLCGGIRYHTKVTTLMT